MECELSVDKVISILFVDLMPQVISSNFKLYVDKYRVGEISSGYLNIITVSLYLSGSIIELISVLSNCKCKFVKGHDSRNPSETACNDIG